MSSDDYSSISSDTGFAGGLSDPTSTQYRERRKVLDIVNTLQSYGLQRQLDLPQIAVVGSQSVGKSSLIESIAGIKLPRASGTCTRCPIECRLTRIQADWSCQVLLRRSTDIHDTEFGPIITNKSEVEERIRRAQLAILNPSKPTSNFLETLVPSSDWNELSFSADIVSVRIAGRDVDDLSFVDLPGIIQAVRDGNDEGDIEQVKKLVESVIRTPNCLILLVVSCETDIENQGARQLARRVDPTGERTMPVLTKPDRIDYGQHVGWIQMVQNQQEKFKHGWHVVKQSNQKQLEDGISWKEARQNEIDFFDNTEPWSGLDESIRSRLGTGYLTRSLGNTLFGLICKRLPGLLKEVETTVKTAKRKLSILPPKPEGDPIPAVYSLVDGFKRDIMRLVAGRPEDGKDGLIQIFRDLSEKFGERIFAQAPCFRPYNSPGIDSDAPIKDTGEFRNIRDEDEGLEPEGPRDPNTFVYVDQALEMARGARTRELPNNTPFAVKKSYIQRFNEGWESPAENLFKQVEHIFMKEITTLVDCRFSTFSHGGLQGTVLQIVRMHLDECHDVAAQKIKDCVTLEREDPFSSNARDFAHYKKKYIELYSTARRDHTRESSDTNAGFLDQLMQFCQSAGQSFNKEKLAQFFNPDKADEAIEIIAEVRAYYQVAYKRFVDYIPMIIDHHLLKRFDENLVYALTKGLALSDEGSSERCAAFLQEDPDVEQTRASLHKILQRFEGARAQLQNIPGVAFMTDTDDMQSETDADFGE